MNELLIGLLGALLATNQPVAVSNLVLKSTGVRLSVPNPDDPVEKELTRILESDDSATDEIDVWIRENNQFKAQGAGADDAALNDRIRKRLTSVINAYEDFLKRNPKHARAALAYASFLNEVHEEEKALKWMEKALELDPKNPAAWNNLANYYGHFGPVKKAFEYYAKAIELVPKEPVYYQNLATTVYLFRKDAREYYGIEEQQVFDKAMSLYRKALDLDPQNFALATDLAQTYYGIKPDRFDDALAAWDQALKLAGNDLEREGIYIHLARIKINAGRHDEARKHLHAVTQPSLFELRDRLFKKLNEKEIEEQKNLAPGAKKS